MDKMAAEHEMNTDDKDFLEHVAMLEEAEIIVDDELKLPISAERTIIKVECQGKKSFDVPVFQIFVPRRYNVAAKYLNDRAILETQTLKNMIPFSVSKNDPETFYREMVTHAKFLHEHRCITIQQVPPSDFSTTFPTNCIDDDMKKTLHHVLLNNKMIDRVHVHKDKTSVIIAVNSKNVKSVEEWLDEKLPDYPYGPTRDTRPTSNASIGSSSNRTGKYSKIFGQAKENDSSTECSFDPSTIASTTSPRYKNNAWSNGPPMNVSFNRRQRNRVSLNLENDDDKNKTEDNHLEDGTDKIRDGDSYRGYGDTFSRTSNNSNTDSIKTEVSAMVEKALAAERATLAAKFEALERQQQEFNNKVKEWDQKMMTLKNDIVDSTVKGTVTLLSGTMSPFATKEDNIKLQEQTNKEIHSAVNSTNNEIASLKDGISALLQRTNHLFASIHDPDETSPPRKTRHLPSTTNQQQEDDHLDPNNPKRLFTEEADTDMITMDSVGGE